MDWFDIFMAKAGFLAPIQKLADGVIIRDPGVLVPSCNDFIATVRPVRHKAYLKLAFEPGDCMQIDWATHGLMRIGDCTRKPHYFATVLCYSRLLFVEFFLSQSMECFLAANRHALEYYGASPRRTMHDNLKTAVLERLAGCAPVFNPRYLDFAAQYGFKPVACNIRRGNEKGRVENSIAYFESFLTRRKIASKRPIKIL
jgi:transposase